MLSPEDRRDLESAVSELDQIALDCDKEDRLSIQVEVRRIKRVLDRHSEVKNPVGGNIDVTTQDKGSFIDKKV